MADELTVTRLLQNLLGVRAPDGQPGDIARVSDATRTMYLTPRASALTTEAHLRWLLTVEPDTQR